MSQPAESLSSGMKPAGRRHACVFLLYLYVWRPSDPRPISPEPGCPSMSAKWMWCSTAAGPNARCRSTAAPDAVRRSSLLPCRNDSPTPRLPSVPKARPIHHHRCRQADSLRIAADPIGLYLSKRAAQVVAICPEGFPVGADQAPLEQEGSLRVSFRVMEDAIHFKHQVRFSVRFRNSSFKNFADAAATD